MSVNFSVLHIVYYMYHSFTYVPVYLQRLHGKFHTVPYFPLVLMELQMEFQFSHWEVFLALQCPKNS